MAQQRKYSYPLMQSPRVATSDGVQKIKTKQGIQEWQDESLSKLSQDAGLLVAPTTPSEAMVLGAGKDAVKMAGTPNQLGAIARAQTQPTRDDTMLGQRLEAKRYGAGLREGRRTEDLLSGEDALETMQPDAKSILDNISKIGQLSTFESRVPALQMSYLTKNYMGGGAIAKPVVNEADPDLNPVYNEVTDDKGNVTKELVSGFPGLKEAITSIANGDIVNGVLAANAALGRDIDNPVTVSELRKYFQGNDQVVADAISKFLPDTPQWGWAMNDEQMKNYGFQSVSDAAQYLGTTPDKLKGMDQWGFQDLMREQQSAFLDVDALMNTMRDPAASYDDKLYAHQQLVEMGFLGKRQMNDKLNNINAQIADGDTVNVLGQELKIEELLNDSTLSGIIKEAVTDPASLGMLAADDATKGLADYISKNVKALDDFFAGMDSTTNAVVTHAAQLSKVQPAGVSDVVMEALVPNWGQVTMGGYQTPPAVTTLKQLPEAKRAEFAGVLQDLYYRGQYGDADATKKFNEMKNWTLVEFNKWKDNGGSLQKEVTAAATRDLGNQLAVQLKSNDANAKGAAFQELTGYTLPDVQKKLADFTKAQTDWSNAIQEVTPLFNQVWSNHDGSPAIMETIRMAGTDINKLRNAIMNTGLTPDVMRGIDVGKTIVDTNNLASRLTSDPQNAASNIKGAADAMMQNTAQTILENKAKEVRALIPLLKSAMDKWQAAVKVQPTPSYRGETETPTDVQRRY